MGALLLSFVEKILNMFANIEDFPRKIHWIRYNKQNVPIFKCCLPVFAAMTRLRDRLKHSNTSLYDQNFSNQKTNQKNQKIENPFNYSKQFTLTEKYFAY